MQKNCLNTPIEVVEDVFGKSPVLAQMLKDITGEESPRIMIVADMNVVQRTPNIGQRMGGYINANGLRLAAEPLILPGGEKIKGDGFFCVNRVLRAMVDAKIGRKDCVLVIGGGSVLDVAGFAAYQVRGGMKVIRMPTSVCAMFDAAFAQTAAITAQNVKDSLIIPAKPAAIVIDPAFADNVMDGVWRAGFGEIVRHGVACDAALLKKAAKLAGRFRKRDAEALRELLKLIVASRMKKGSSSFAEWATLRLEAMSSFRLPHGYAVPISILIEIGYATAKGYVSEDDAKFVRDLLVASGSLDGFYHSHSLLLRIPSLLMGLDAYALRSQYEGIPLPGPLGKVRIEQEPDREVYAKVIEELSNICIDIPDKPEPAVEENSEEGGREQ